MPTAPPQTGAAAGAVDAGGSCGRAFDFWLAQYRRTWRGTAISHGRSSRSASSPRWASASGSWSTTARAPTTLDGVSYLGSSPPACSRPRPCRRRRSSRPTRCWARSSGTGSTTRCSRRRCACVDVLAGHLLFVVLRLSITHRGLPGRHGAVRRDLTRRGRCCACPVGVLTGLAYAPAIFAFSATRENDSGFAMLFRFGIVPMFLFSGTFFPVSQLPDWLEPVAWVVPLWHGVDLCRALALGHACARLGAGARAATCSCGSSSASSLARADVRAAAGHMSAPTARPCRVAPPGAAAVGCVGTGGARYLIERNVRVYRTRLAGAALRHLRADLLPVLGRRRGLQAGRRRRAARRRGGQLHRVRRAGDARVQRDERRDLSTRRSTCSSS